MQAIDHDLLASVKYFQIDDSDCYDILSNKFILQMVF